jgi:hypothetical protein
MGARKKGKTKEQEEKKKRRKEAKNPRWSQPLPRPFFVRIAGSEDAEISVLAAALVLKAHN